MRALLISTLLVLQIFFTLGHGMAQRFHAGFNLGLDATTINGSTLSNHLKKVGVIVGAVVNTSITPKSLFQFEINFIQKGSLQPPDSLGNGYSKVALSYIEIPLLIRRRIKFNVSKRPVTRFEFEFGTSIARLLSVTSINSQNAALPTDGVYKKYDLSLLAGLNVNLSKNIYFNLRYSNSVIPIVERNAQRLYLLTYTWNRGNNMVLQFSFKFVFNGVKSKDEPAADAPATDGN